MSNYNLQNRMKYVPVFNYFICGYYLFKGFAAGEIPGKEIAKFFLMAVVWVILLSILVVVVQQLFQSEQVNFYVRVISIYGCLYLNSFYAIRIQKKYDLL